VIEESFTEFSLPKTELDGKEGFRTLYKEEYKEIGLD